MGFGGAINPIQQAWSLTPPVFMQITSINQVFGYQQRHPATTIKRQVTSRARAAGLKAMIDGHQSPRHTIRR